MNGRIECDDDAEQDVFELEWAAHRKSHDWKRIGNDWDKHRDGHPRDR